MLSLLLLMVMLGVANWFATTLIVESELFRPVRDWVGNRYEDAAGTKTYGAWGKLHYLVSCHMCAGTWVALAMALFTPAVVNVPVVGWVLTALVIKGIGHLVLLLNNKGNARIELDRAEAAEAAMHMLPDLGGLLGALERVDRMKNRPSPDRYRRDRNPAVETMFGDMGRMPTKPKAKFEPFTDEDLAEMDVDAPEDAAFAKPETRFKG